MMKKSKVNIARERNFLLFRLAGAEDVFRWICNNAPSQEIEDFARDIVIKANKLDMMLRQKWGY